MSLVMPTRILLVGSGGREHALAWKLASEPGVNTVVAAPGSDGIATEPRVVRAQADITHATRLVEIAKRHAVELAVIGPEAALAAGVADALAAAGVPTFGPGESAARIETSKAFCREVAASAGVPMAEGRAFEAGDREAAIQYATELADRGGVVIKADGLAAGKGVTVCANRDEARTALEALDDAVVVEERLTGSEASVIALCDGRDAVALPAARDHKRLLDGDEGPNTGGMGAYSPLPDLPDDKLDDILDAFHRPVLAELAGRGTRFRGALYAGLMLTSDGPRLLEFNARFGDPETQVILPRLGVALGPLLLAAARGALPEACRRLGIEWGVVPVARRATVGIVLAGASYPMQGDVGSRIEGLTEAQEHGALVFHAGTRRRDTDTWETNGGRVITIVGRGLDQEQARAAAEDAADRVSWPGMQRRHDIGANAVLAGTPA
jgi:phosphoribosylamine--glycine ligase